MKNENLFRIVKGLSGILASIAAEKVIEKIWYKYVK